MAKRLNGELARIERELEQAESFEQWLELAAEHDAQSGADVWRETDASRLYDNASIALRLKRLQRLRKRGDDRGLLFALNEGIHGNMAGMGQSRLYDTALCGTKHLIEDYIEAICDSLDYLSPRVFPGISWAERTASCCSRAISCAAARIVASIVVRRVLRSAACS